MELRNGTLIAACCLALWLAPGSSGALALDQNPRACVVLTGLGGVPEYEENFEKWGSALEMLCTEQMQASLFRVDGRSQRREDILQLFNQIAARQDLEEIWMFAVGHGSDDGRDYKFNIRGPDLTGSDLSLFLDSVSDRKLYVVLATSASGDLAASLAAPNRVIVTATKAASQKRPPLFASFFIEGAASAEADTNKDGRVSLAENFEFCSKRVQAWYADRGRLQTEHPLINDKQGNLALFAYLSSPPEQSYRSLEARQLLPERTRLEREVEDLKLRKNEMSTADYYVQLEKLLIELAELNERIRKLEGEE